MKKHLLFILIFSLTQLNSQIQKVEPAFWWHGMKNPELQILVYGKDVAKHEVELSDHIKIKNLTKTENPNYVFITINTSEVKKSSFKINFRNGKKTVDSYTYKLKKRNPSLTAEKNCNFRWLQS